MAVAMPAMMFAIKPRLDFPDMRPDAVVGSPFAVPKTAPKMAFALLLPALATRCVSRAAALTFERRLFFAHGGETDRWAGGRTDGGAEGGKGGLKKLSEKGLTIKVADPPAAPAPSKTYRSLLPLKSGP